jgi:hypothetical protein
MSALQIILSTRENELITAIKKNTKQYPLLLQWKGEHIGSPLQRVIQLMVIDKGIIMLNTISDNPEDFIEEIEKIQNILPAKIDANPENVEKGLAKLVLTLIELIRQLMEKQSMRRMEGGSLSDEETERLGETLMKLEEKVEELKGVFGIEDEELNLNLGPLGDLM